MYLNLSTHTHQLDIAFNSTYEQVIWSNLLGNYLQLSFSYLVATALILVCIFIIFGNSLVVTAIVHEHQLHSVTNYLIASLAAADCFVGALVMPFSIISDFLLGEWIFGPTFCHIWHSFDVLASTASIMNLCAISLDRYLAITDPISYPRKMTPKRVGFLIICLWTCSAAISFPAIIWWQSVAKDGPLVRISEPALTDVDKVNPTANQRSKYLCVFTSDTSYLLFSSTISFYAPLCVMLYAYIKIYQAAVRQTKFLNFGSKQVVVGGKRGTRSRSKYLRRFINSSDRSTNNQQQLLDGGLNANENDCQHLVLRVHRGGGGNAASSAAVTTSTANSNTLSSTINNDNNANRAAKNCDNKNRWINKSNSVKSSNSVMVYPDNKLNRNHSTIKSSRYSNDQNGPQNVIGQKMSTSFRYRNDASFIRRSQQIDHQKFDRKDKMRVNSQRFEPQEDYRIDNQSIPVMNQIYHSDIEPIDGVAITTTQSTQLLPGSNNNFSSNQKYDIKDGKHLLATINGKSSSVDVTVLKCDPSDANMSRQQQRHHQQQQHQHKKPLSHREAYQKSSNNRSNESSNDASVVMVGPDNNNEIDTKNLSMIPAEQSSSEVVIGSVASSSSDTFESSIISVLMRPSPSTQVSSNHQSSMESKDAPYREQDEKQPMSSDVMLTDTTSQIINNSTLSNDVDVNQQKKRIRKKMSKLAKERKAAKTLGIVVGVFILCWLPFFVINILVALCGNSFIRHFETTMSIVTWLGWLNSAMNPVIYACWSRDFRRAFIRTLRSWLEFICPYNIACRSLARNASS